MDPADDKPLAIDLFCGLGGWTEGLLAEGYTVVGFDNCRHIYGDAKYPAQLVIQDVLSLHGAQFRNAALIVASPPCQAYSYRAMPWSRAKALPPPDNSLFLSCFRIQWQACYAADRHIPLIVENVRGAQKWVGRSRWNYGSYHLWGDVPALMPMTIAREVSPHWRMDGEDSRKNTGGSWFGVSKNNPVKRNDPRDDIKCGGDWFDGKEPSQMRHYGSRSSKRKQASALIAKIPLHLARHIGRTFYPPSVKSPPPPPPPRV